MNSSDAVSILIVDDEQFFRLVLGKMLANEGYTVVAEAADGDEAVLKYSEFKPSLVFMDIYMPTKNGIEAIRDIISLAPDAKILICSGTGYEDDINAALKAGARGVIFKPFFDDEVLETVRNVLAV
jgi:two-component system chemotaxis response regulator CheY